MTETERLYDPSAPTSFRLPIVTLASSTKTLREPVSTFGLLRRETVANTPGRFSTGWPSPAAAAGACREWGKAAVASQSEKTQETTVTAVARNHQQQNEGTTPHNQRA